MKVTVKPLPKETWHGKTGKESFTRPKKIEVLYDIDKGGYATGLTDEDVVKYSKILGVSLDNIFNPEEPHPYWGSKAGVITLPNHTVIFDTDKPAEYVKIKNMKASKDVANSLAEYEKGLWPEATHYIFDEEEEISVTASKINLRNKCISMAAGMSHDEKLHVIQILSNKSFRGRSQDFADVEINNIIENSPAEFHNLTTMTKEELVARGTILEALLKHKLVKEGAKIMYMGETIGHDIDQAVKYFLDPDNQAMKVAILEKLLV